MLADDSRAAPLPPLAAVCLLLLLAVFGRATLGELSSDDAALLAAVRTGEIEAAPLARWSWQLDAWSVETLGGGAVWPRAQGMLWHLLAVLLAARAARACGVRPAAALIGAALFGLHPAMVEIVASLEARGLALAAIGVLLAVIGVCRIGRRGWLALAFGTAVALAAHPAGAILCVFVPLAVTLAPPPRRWLPAVFVAAATLVALLLWPGGGLEPSQAPQRAARLLAAASWPPAVSVAPPAHGMWPAIAALAAIVVAVGAGRARIALALAGGAIALVPSALAWQDTPASDAALVLALPWWTAMSGALLARFRGGVWLAAAGIAALALASWQRAGDFASEERLWQRTHERQPEQPLAALRVAERLMATEPERAAALFEQAARADDPALVAAAQAGLRDLARQDGRLQEARRLAEAACAAAAAMPDGARARRARLQAQLALSSLRLAAGDAAGVRAALAAARALGGDDPALGAHEALLLLAEARDAAGRVAVDAPAATRAQALLDAALQRAPAHFEALIARARWQLATDRLLAAVQSFQRARAAAPRRAEGYLGEADVFLASGDHGRAEAVVREAIAAGVRDPNLLMRLGLALVAQGNLAAARSYYERYLDVRPRDRDVRRALAAVIATDAMTKVNQVPVAVLEADAQRIRELDPEQPKADLIAALAARLRRAHQEALVLAERAAAALPDDADARRLFAESLRDRGYELLTAGDRRASAFDHFRRFVDVAPADVPTDAARTMLDQEWQRQRAAGVAAFQQGQLDAAEACFRRCLFLQPDDAGPQLNLGLVLLQRGSAQHAEALACFERAEAGQRRAGGDASLPVLYQVLALKEMGRSDEARQRGEAFLAAPTVAERAVLERIERAIR